MRAVGAGPEFGMELAGHHPRMVLDLGYLHQPVIRRKPAEDHAFLLEMPAVVIIKFIAVAVALIDNLSP